MDTNGILEIYSYLIKKKKKKKKKRYKKMFGYIEAFFQYIRCLYNSKF